MVCKAGGSLTQKDDLKRRRLLNPLIQLDASDNSGEEEKVKDDFLQIILKYAGAKSGSVNLILWDKRIFRHTFNYEEAKAVRAGR